jgi:hypothetical protein
MTLLPCHACGRHVRSGDDHCPFCGTSRSCDEKPPRVEPAGRRLKAIAMSAALGVSACSGSVGSQGEGKDAAVDSPVGQPAYGVVEPPQDGGSDATTDSPGGQPAYGAVVPPNDGGSETG